MSVDPKEEIKTWLKANNRDRQWLGTRLDTAVQTINNWLSSSRPIPEAKLALIRRLIEDDAAAEAQRRQQIQPRAQVFSLEVDLPTFRAYSAAALSHHQTLEQWAISELNSAATEAREAAIRDYHRAAQSTREETVSLNEPAVDYAVIDLPMTTDEAALIRAAAAKEQADAEARMQGRNPHKPKRPRKSPS